MDNLTYQLRQLCGRNRDGAYSTQHDRLGMLTLISRQLLEMGYRHMRPDSLKRKHVAALVERWQREGLDTGTIKNRGQRRPAGVVRSLRGTPASVSLTDST